MGNFTANGHADVQIIYIPFYHPQDSDPEEGVFWRAEDQGPDDYLARRHLNVEIGPVELFQRCREDSADPLARFQQIPEDLTATQRAIEAGRILQDLYCVAALSVASETTLAADRGS